MGDLAHHIHSENIAIITILTVTWGRNGDKGGSSLLVKWRHAVSWNEVLLSLEKPQSCLCAGKTTVVGILLGQLSSGQLTAFSGLPFPEDSVFPMTVASASALESKVKAALAPRWRLSIAWHCVCQGPSRALSLVKGWRWLSLRADQA